MSQTITGAAPQPAQAEQTSVEKKSVGNVSESAFSRMLAGKQVAPVKNEAPAEAGPKVETPNAEPAAEATQDAAAEAQAESAAEAAPETEADEVLSNETHSLDPKLQAKIDRKIGKEVAKRKVLEAEVAELRTKVLAMPDPEEKQVIVQVPDNTPLAEINDMTALAQLKTTAKTEMRWAEAQLDDDDFPKEGKQTDRGFVTKAQLKELIRNARVCQEDLIPTREQFLAARTQAKQQAYEKFPFLKDPTQPGYALAKQAYKDNPWLHSRPNSDFIVGLQVRGYLAMQADEVAAKAKTVQKLKPKPTSGQAEVTSDASTTRVPVGALTQQALESEDRNLAGKKGVSAKDFAASLVRKMNLRNSR